MVQGFEINRNVFGNQTEAYVASLLNMRNNPNGSGKPDLESLNKLYVPKLFIELKSSSENPPKGSMVDSQLHCSIISLEDYDALFHGRMSENLDKGLLRGTRDSVMSSLGSVVPCASYYGIIERHDTVKIEDIKRAHDPLRIVPGDIYLVPQAYAFASFAAGRSMKTGESMETVVENLQKVIDENLAGSKRKIPGFETSRQIQRGVRKGAGKLENKHSWTDIHANQISAWHNGNISLSSPRTKRRVELMKDYYPELAKLVPVPLISGPKKTTITVLANPKHTPLFDQQLRKVVKERSPALEKIFDKRKRAIEDIERCADERRRDWKGQYHLLSNERSRRLVDDATAHPPFDHTHRDFPYTWEELSRLLNWQP